MNRVTEVIAGLCVFFTLGLVALLLHERNVVVKLQGQLEIAQVSAQQSQALAQTAHEAQIIAERQVSATSVALTQVQVDFEESQKRLNNALTALDVVQAQGADETVDPQIWAAIYGKGEVK